jgi:hypothetical protein
MSGVARWTPALNVKIIAACSILARHAPRPEMGGEHCHGSHEAARAVGGFLSRCSSIWGAWRPLDDTATWLVWFPAPPVEGLEEARHLNRGRVTAASDQQRCHS